jgi:hypothetical protein
MCEMKARYDVRGEWPFKTTMQDGAAYSTVEYRID